MAHDHKNRPLTVGDRITVPAVITAIDATAVTFTPLAVPKGMEDDAKPVTMEARLLLRAGTADNNGLDDWILEDVEQHIANLVRAETESRVGKFEGLRKEAQDAHDAHLQLLSARLEEATKAHEAKLADAQAQHDARVAGLDKNFNTILAYHTARLNALAVAPPAPPTAAPSEG